MDNYYSTLRVLRLTAGAILERKGRLTTRRFDGSPVLPHIMRPTLPLGMDRPQHKVETSSMCLRRQWSERHGNWPTLETAANQFTRQSRVLMVQWLLSLGKQACVTKFDLTDINQHYKIGDRSGTIHGRWPRMDLPADPIIVNKDTIKTLIAIAGWTNESLAQKMGITKRQLQHMIRGEQRTPNGMIPQAFTKKRQRQIRRLFKRANAGVTVEEKEQQGQLDSYLPDFRDTLVVWTLPIDRWKRIAEAKPDDRAAIIQAKEPELYAKCQMDCWHTCDRRALCVLFPENNEDIIEVIVKRNDGWYYGQVERDRVLSAAIDSGEMPEADHDCTHEECTNCPLLDDCARYGKEGE
jgi:hypothetical protein